MLVVFDADLHQLLAEGRLVGRRSLNDALLISL